MRASRGLKWENETQAKEIYRQGQDRCSKIKILFCL